MKRNLIIRTDAGNRIASGHLIRCRALAQRWKAAGGHVIFITQCGNKGLRESLLREQFEVIDLEKMCPDRCDWEVTSAVLRDYPDAWVILDGYHFDSAYQRKIKDAGHSLLLIDDMAHLQHYYGDILLNQNINAGEMHYSCESYTRQLLGTRYALLRSEFLPWQGKRKVILKEARRILITLGGSDPDNATLELIKALERLNDIDLDVTVVAGPTNVHMGTLEEACLSSTHKIRLLQSVESMSELMAWADIAVSAAGSTCWELAFMGVPTLVLVLADNQRGVAEGLDDAGIALNLGWRENLNGLIFAQTLEMLISDSVRRTKMSENAQESVDGNGASSVIAYMDEADGNVRENLSARRASIDDAKLLWHWANDRGVRNNSFHPNEISFDEHVKWLEGKLSSSDTRMWIVENNQVPVAQVRYDRVDNDTAETDISVDPECRGQGIGTSALIITVAMAHDELGVSEVRGVVFSSNESSARIFIKSGFRHTGRKVIDDTSCDIYAI